jgi:hypothetical protein
MYDGIFGGVEMACCARSCDVVTVHRSDSRAGPVAHVMCVGMNADVI